MFSAPGLATATVWWIYVMSDLRMIALYYCMIVFFIHNAVFLFVALDLWWCQQPPELPPPELPPPPAELQPVVDDLFLL